ncbi:hypothetical protein PFISCL1PPCAC_25329, partial [Pristionchus fissidentatus]
EDGIRSGLESSDDEEMERGLNIKANTVNIEDEDNSVDMLLRDVKSDVYSNPIKHNFNDEHIFDDDDFIDAQVNLSEQRKMS